MAAKSVRVSADGVTFYNLPGSTADVSIDSGSADDSIFGTTFSSSQPTLFTWNMTANGYFKGFPGYQATLKRAGSPTAFTAEATTAHGGGFYITDRAKSIWDVGSVTVSDSSGAIDAEDIDYIDYLHGGVVFAGAFTPDGAVTVSGDYLPTSEICRAQTFSLTQGADTENVTDFCEARDNGGFAVFSYQQQNVELSLDGFYSDSSGFLDDLLARDQIIIEVNPDGAGKSVARGFFRATSQGQSGDVGSTETENITYSLSVPEGVRFPFKWYHATDSAIPAAVKLILDAWEGREEVIVEYQAEGSSLVRSGVVLVSDASLDSGVEDINEFSFDFQGSGVLSSD